ncbi:uncharacterized protein [Acropora muricata]
MFSTGIDCGVSSFKHGPSLSLLALDKKLCVIIFKLLLQSHLPLFCLRSLNTTLCVIALIESLFQVRGLPFCARSLNKTISLVRLAGAFHRKHEPPLTPCPRTSQETISLVHLDRAPFHRKHEPPLTPCPRTSQETISLVHLDRAPFHRKHEPPLTPCPRTSQETISFAGFDLTQTIPLDHLVERDEKLI